MKIYVDRKLIEKNLGQEVILSWPALIACLELGETDLKFSSFQETKLFSLICSYLEREGEREILERFYDQIFVENLTAIKAFEWIEQSFLLSSIRKAIQKKPFLRIALKEFEEKLIEDPYNTLHDLMLYLAWDRVCVAVATLFEEQSLSEKALSVFKECLLESFQHITELAKTKPSFFRLMEALYAYYMRQEKLQDYTDSEWQILCQAAEVLTDRDALCDVVYVDRSVGKKQVDAVVWTMDSKKHIQASLSLACMFLEKIKEKMPEWLYGFYPVEIVSKGEKT